MKHAPDALRHVARMLRDNSYAGARIHYNAAEEVGIMIPGRGRYEIVAEADRAYYWRNDAGKLSDPFTCDLYLSDGEEIGEHLIHLLEDEREDHAS